MAVVLPQMFYPTVGMSECLYAMSGMPMVSLPGKILDIWLLEPDFVGHQNRAIENPIKPGPSQENWEDWYL